MKTTRSCCERFVVGGLKLPPFHFGRSSRDFGSGVVCHTGDWEAALRSFYAQAGARPGPAVPLSVRMPATASMTDVSRTDFTKRNDSFDQRKSGKEHQRKRGTFLFFSFIFTLSCERLVLFRANSERKCLWFELIFHEKTNHLQPMSFVFPLLGLAAFVAAACSRQLRCRINLIIATIYLFF